MANILPALIFCHYVSNSPVLSKITNIFPSSDFFSSDFFILHEEKREKSLENLM